jgi:hypothetical protein
MNVSELRIEGAQNDATLAAARWALFVFSEIRHVYRIGTTDQAAVLHTGEAAPHRWVAALADAGCAATTVEREPASCGQPNSSPVPKAQLV